MSTTNVRSEDEVLMLSVISGGLFSDVSRFTPLPSVWMSPYLFIEKARWFEKGYSLSVQRKTRQHHQIWNKNEHISHRWCWCIVCSPSWFFLAFGSDMYWRQGDNTCYCVWVCLRDRLIHIFMSVLIEAYWVHLWHLIDHNGNKAVFDDCVFSCALGICGVRANIYFKRMNQ